MPGCRIIRGAHCIFIIIIIIIIMVYIIGLFYDTNFELIELQPLKRILRKHVLRYSQKMRQVFLQALLKQRLRKSS